MKFFMETHVRIDEYLKKVQKLIDSWAQHFVVYWF